MSGCFLKPYFLIGFFIYFFHSINYSFIHLVIQLIDDLSSKFKHYLSGL